MTETTLESQTGRIVPASWLYVAAGLVVVAVAAVGLQLHVLTAEVHAASAAITAQSERAAQCPAPAPVPAEIVAAETEPAPARQAQRLVINAPVAASDTASTAWSEPTELDGALATFNRQLQEYGQ